MRTTLTLADDVASAVESMRSEHGLGVSDAVNELVRRGLASRQPRERFEQKTHRMGARTDLANVWEAIETADGPAAR